MYSFSFPNMFNGKGSKLIQDKEAVKSNLQLLFKTERNSLYGDPYFGTQLLQVLFEQPSSIVADLLIDEIYTAIQTFIPQIFVSRERIKVTTDGKNVYASVPYIFLEDNTSDLYTINLTETNNN